VRIGADGTGSGSYPLAGFGIRRVELSGFTIGKLVTFVLMIHCKKRKCVSTICDNTSL
jgi:hypothetical protein